MNHSGILTRLFERRTLDENTGRGLIDKIRGGGYGPTTAGITVTPDTALTYSAVFACVRVLAESIASLPFITYRRLPGGGKERATDDPRYTLLHDRPNDEMTSAEWREALMVNTTLWGNGYSQVVPSLGGKPVALWPMLSKFMEVRREHGALMYYSSDNSVQEPRLPGDQMLHIKSISLNGLMGISPIRMARQAIGLGMATEVYGAAFFGNGAQPGVVLEHPGKLSDDAYRHLKESWTEAHAGPENAHRPAILEDGVKMDKLTMPNDDAQFLETRKFQVTDIARWFRIQPHMIGDLSDATFSNIEHQGLDFVIHTLRPWLTRIEQPVDWRLFSAAEHGTYYAEMLVDDLLRGDIQSRYNAYSIAKQWGWMNSDEIRGKENMNPIPGGDVYITPLNYQPLTQIGQPVAPAASAARALFPVYREAVERIVHRAQRDIADAARKYLAKADVDGFWRFWPAFDAELRQYAERSLLPAANAHEQLDRRMSDPRRRVSKWAVDFLLWELDWVRQTVDGARIAGIELVEAIDDQLKHHEERERISEWTQSLVQETDDGSK